MTHDCLSCAETQSNLLMATNRASSAWVAPTQRRRLGGSDCPHRGDMSLRSLRLRVAIVQGDELAQIALPRSSSAAYFEPSRKVYFGAMEGTEEEDDAISLAASAREEWSNSPLDYTAPHGSNAGDLHHSDLELLSVLSKVVDELGLEWAPPAEPARSRPAETRPLFPEVHDKIKKSWNAPLTNPVHNPGSSLLIQIISSLVETRAGNRYQKEWLRWDKSSHIKVHPELPRRLASFSPIRERAAQRQAQTPRSYSELRSDCKYAKEHAGTEPEHILFRSGAELNQNTTASVGGEITKTDQFSRSLQIRAFSPAKMLSKDDRPDGRCLDSVQSRAPRFRFSSG